MREQRREQAFSTNLRQFANPRRTDACHEGFGVAETARPDSLLRVGRRFSCGSSVVEHSIGKGEVESSILSRSTIKNNDKSKQ